VVKLGGPVYRIGVGGGSASSVEVRKCTAVSDIFRIYK
jgi:phosphoribosylformylglycinamidine (FGAM) synthase-like enzyme